MIDIKIGDVLQGRVSAFASGGEGIVKIDRFPVFVPFALVGEIVRAKLTHLKKDCGFGELVQVLSPSDDRVKPICPYFFKCGGCDLQHMREGLRLELKRDAVRDAFRKICGLDVDVPLPVSGAQTGYRNKLALPFAKNARSGRVYLGFFERRSHKVVPIKWCPACGEWTGDLIEALTSWATEFGASVYDEASGEGLLRHAVARMTDRLSLTIVANGDALPHLDALERKLQAKFQDFCLYISPNRKRTNVIFGDEVRLVCGLERDVRLGKFSAPLSPKAFLQVNDEIRDKLYDAVSDALASFDGDIAELYSGAGILTAELALRLPSSRITSVEIEPSATRSAAALMRKLGLDGRVDVICGDALAYMQKAAPTSRPRALILDPPRRGADKEILTGALSAGFERIIYISCNPQTLARDAAILRDGYALSSVKTFDMFPMTKDVETLCVFERSAVPSANKKP